MKKYAFGVDIGGTTIKMGFFETSGELIEKWEIPTRTEDNGVNILPDIAADIDKKLGEKSIDKSDVEGVGVGVPGPVDEDGTVFRCVNLGWGVFNVQIELNRLTELKVKVGNDANVAALGEMWQGGGKGYKNIVMVTLGTGVGGGVIINEKIVAGSDGAGGEIGHINMKENEKEACGCGNHGCLEQYASATGIVRTTKKFLEEHPDAETELNAKTVTAKDIFDCAKNGDEVAEKMVDSPVSRSAEDRSKKQAAKTVRTACKNHIDSGKERRRGRTASRKSALFLRALVLAFVFTGMIAGFGLMTRASSTGKQEKSKYYDTVTIGYGEDMTDIVDTYCDKGEYESSDAYIREICEINSLPYQKGAVPDLGVGTKIVIPYYSTVIK